MNVLLYLGVSATELILLLFVVSFPLILTIYSLLDVTRSSFQDPTNKIIWAIIILLAPVVGALAYLIWGRQQKSTAS